MKHKKSTGTGSEQGRCSEWKKNRFLFLMLVPGLIVLFLTIIFQWPVLLSI